MQQSKKRLKNSECMEESNIKTTLKDELRHNKTKKVTVRPAKTQISLGIRLVWSESLLCA